MASFGPAYALIAKHEGYYVNNPADLGGETYAGITRKYNPTWVGWPILDSHKPLRWNQRVPALDPYVADFYLKQKWQKHSLGSLQNQQVANAVMDSVVLHGFGSGLVQRAVNASGARVTVDNSVGPMTVRAINSVPSNTFLTNLARVRLDYVKKVNQNNPNQEQFMANWTKRLNSFGGGASTGGGLFLLAVGVGYWFFKSRR